MKKSENEILQDAQKAKKVIDAIYSLLDVIDQKTGFEQMAADAEERYKRANEQELVAKAHLATVQSELDKSSEDLESARAFAKKIITEAQTQADNTRLLAKNEAGLLIQSAQETASQVLADLKKDQGKIEDQITARQKALDGIESEITTKTTELAKVQGDLDAAKDEIRRKFLSN